MFVPAELVPDTDVAVDDNTQAVCLYLDLTSVEAPANPGFVDESVDGEFLSGDDIWTAAFYSMVYANCERQARGVKPFRMYSNEKATTATLSVITIRSESKPEKS